MTTKLEKLLFRIGLVESVSAPLARIDKQVQSFNRHATAGGALLGASAAGAWALQRAVSSVLAPALEMNRALGSVRTLDVQGESLRRLEQRALSFSIRYGESASEFVRSSYDIQSAIAGLQGNELGTFTEASALLAKGTLAEMSTVTDYMGTMYGIFKSNADKIGRANWVQIVAGQTATAVQMFKTNGGKMAAAFTSLGADAQAHGIQMAEQMAILGKLQTTMSGSEAGTKYKAFLRGVGTAQKELGLEFTDSAGRMLPMVDILQKIQGRVSGMSSVAQGQLLKKAFGSDEAASLLSLLLLDTQGLVDNIQQLGNVSGMDKARKMAADMIDPFDRWKAGVSAVTTVIGKSMLPLLTPMVDRFTAGANTIVDWSQRFPYLSRAIGTSVALLAGMIGVVLTLAAVGGILQLTIAGLVGLKVAWTAATTAWAAAGKIGAAVTTLWGKSLKAVRIAVLLFNIALWANPITWIVVGVVALIAGLYLLVKHWDSVKAATLGFFNAFAERWGALRKAIEGNPVLHFIFTPLLAGIDLISLLFKHLDKIPEWFAAFKSWLDGLGIFDVLGRAADWLIGKLNLIPGINIEAQVQDQRSQVPRAALPRFQTSAVPPGGISQEINNNQRGGLHIEKVELNQPVSGGNFVDELEMAAG